MRKFSKKQYLVAGVAAAAVIGLGTGTAIAYWSTTGTGGGSATTATGNASAISITDNSNLLTAMYPGDSQQTVTVTATNTDTSQSAYVAGVTAVLSVTPVSGTCGPSDYLLNGVPGTSSPVSLAWTPQELGASGSTTPPDHASTTMHLQFNDKATLQDGCKGAAVTITYASS